MKMHVNRILTKVLLVFVASALIEDHLPIGGRDGPAVVEAAVKKAVRKKIPKWHLKMAQSQGPNTCAVEEIPGTNKKFWTECRYWTHRKICGHDSVIRYECCEGFDIVPGEDGCMAVKPMKNILDTAEDLGATKFVQYLREAGLADRLRQGPYTLFAPINSAIESLPARQREDLNRTRNNPWSPILLYHLTENRVQSKEIDTSQMVSTLDRGQQMRITKYSNGMITANCAPIVRKDQEASNGVVHLVDSVLMPISIDGLTEALVRDGRFVQFSRLLRESNVAGEIGGAGPFTVFAPYDEAFQKYPTERLERINSDPHARRALVRAHIIPYALCEPAVTDVHKLRTLIDEKLNVQCNDTGTYVNDAKLTNEFLVTTNGVVQIIGHVLVPNRAKSILELIEGIPEASTFLKLVRVGGLSSALYGVGNLTVFIPSDEAFKEVMTEKELSLRYLTGNTTVARDTVMYHVVQGRHLTNRMTDGQRVSCVDGQNDLRLRLYRKDFGVESALIKSMDTEGQNGVIHMIDRVLRPPTNNIFDVLQRDGNYSIMLEALQKVRITEPDLLKPGSKSSLTLFAPNDEAFRRLGWENLQKFMNNPEYLTQVVKNHLVDSMVPSCGFKPKLHYRVKTKQDDLGVHKIHHRIYVGNSEIVKQDVVTRDGIVHYVDRVILPQEERVTEHH